MSKTQASREKDITFDGAIVPADQTWYAKRDFEIVYM